MGRTGEEGVALRSRRCEYWRWGGWARTKLLRMELAWLKLLNVSRFVQYAIEVLHTCRFFLGAVVSFS
jgi:hypothetical protein